MINCQITHEGKVTDRIHHAKGLLFADNHGVERYNHITSTTMEASLKEWHYDRFGIMNQHFQGKADNTQFTVLHEVRPAMMLSIALCGTGTKNVFLGNGHTKEVVWKTGDANICFLNGPGGLCLNLNRNLTLDMLSMVIPQQFIEGLIARNEEVFHPLSVFVASTCDNYLLFRENHPLEKAVMRSARDVQRARMMGNNAHKYLESKIIDCLSGLLLPGCISPSAGQFNLLVRDKMHDVRDIILSCYQDMPSLHDLATMVGTNECTLKKAFKQEFGSTVFQYLFDYRMNLAAHYLLDTALPIADIGIRLGYDYQSHFCTAFKRKYGMSPMDFRLQRTSFNE